MISLILLLIFQIIILAPKVPSRPLDENGKNVCIWNQNDLLLDCANHDLRLYFENHGTIEYLLPSHQRSNVLNKNIRVNLSNCNLKELKRKDFGQCKIVWLNLSENPDIKLDIQTNLFDETNLDEEYLDEPISNTYPIYDSLEYLDISNSHQNEIPAGFINLRKLVFKNNRLKQLNPADFFNMQHLEHINLSGNKTNDIHPDTFGNLNLLEELDLSNNDFKYLHPYIIFKNEQLQVLKIEYTKLTTFPIIYSNSMRTLSLAYGVITQINDDVLGGLLKIKTINLSNNRGLRKLGSGLKSETLTELDLSSCMLDEISDAAFDELPNLTILNLANNKLTGLSKNHFKNNHKLKKVKINGNPWICDLNNQKFIEFRNYVTENKVIQITVQCNNTEDFGKDWKKVEEKDIYISITFYIVIVGLIVTTLAIMIYKYISRP